MRHTILFIDIQFMRHSIAFYLLTTIIAHTSLAQSAINIQTFKPTPVAFQYLLQPNSEVAKSDTVNEMMIDLVEPMLIDSVIEKKKQHHKLFILGWFIHAFGGYNWRAVSMQKEKFVGSAVRSSRSGEEEYTEYDINFDLNFHLKKYLWRVMDAYDIQRKYHKQDFRKTHRTNFDTIPFVRDTNSIDIRNYRLHCELTPPAAYRQQLNYLFYPTLPGAGGMGEHHNFGSAKPCMGFYGVLCNDCNHNCGPELHPYEWVWWLKINKTDSSLAKIWHVGLFHEGSNRLKKWSINPMQGSVKIPFAFSLKTDNSRMGQIKVEHLVFGQFLESEMKKLKFLYPDSTFLPDKSYAIKVMDGENSIGEVRLNFPQAFQTSALRYWFTDVNLDKETQILSGYINLVTSVKDVYTTRITISP